MILRERRRPSFDGELVMRTTLAWVLVCVLLLVTGAGAILSNRFPDPDDALRLIQVRDLIAGQSWFDLTQHRIDAAHGGVPMHWSRLVDLPLAAMLLLLTPIVGSSLAETITIVAVPLLTFGLALLLAGRIAWRVIGDEAATFACLALAISVPVVGQLRPLRIDHHGWQIVLALATLNALMARSARTGGRIAGLALAAWLAISLEGLPMAAAFAGIAALRWLRNPVDCGWLVHLMQGLAGGSLLLFFATRGIGDLTVHCDAIGPVHLAMFALASLVLTALGSVRALPMVPTLAGFALAGGGALAVLLTAAPHCATGTFDMLDPVVRRFWFDNVLEGMPVWRQDAGTALQTLLPPLIALWSTVKLMGNSQDWLRRWWRDYALLLAAALLLSVLVTRAGAVAGAFAAVPLGWQMREWIVAARRHRVVRRRVAALAGVGLALLPTLPLTLLGLAMPLRAASAVAAPRVSSCGIAEAAATLRALPQGDILAPLDIGPGLLLETGHSVVATGHHRAGPAIRAVIDSFTGNAAAAHKIIAERGIEYVALCPQLAEPVLYRTAAPDGFAAQLSRGHIPDWLAPIAVPGGVDLKVWRVVR
ncbi:MAG TPA: hypothetical protein VHG29_03585 [Novosphingobium sp.]|nr:hypothetical protein [Novosphingobium sp.]